MLDAWSSSMLRLARSFVSTHASAEEVVQDTWLAVLKGLPGFEGRSAFHTLGVPDPGDHGEEAGRAGAAQRAVEQRRARRRRADRRPVPVRGPDDPYPDGWREFPAVWDTPEEIALAGEIHTVLAEILDELPDRQRAVLSLRDVAGHRAGGVRAARPHAGQPAGAAAPGAGRGVRAARRVSRERGGP
jgi:RNA polymerase sigma-70 factor (ECF subfamily)